MNYEVKKYDNICSIQFPELKKEIIDIDCLFKTTNYHFYILLTELNINVDFDFTKKDNKRLYTHTFIKQIIEFLKNKEDGYKPYFYSNLLTKDTFRNNLIKKIKRIFGFDIWEDVYEFDVIPNSLSDCDINCKVEGLLGCDKKPKSFKHIKKFLEKEGLTNLNGVYFENLENKIQIYL